jgi:hypothetical protein
MQGLVWGKIATPQVKVAKVVGFPNNTDRMLLTTEPVKVKGGNRKFSFNLAAQTTLELHKQVGFETFNTNAVFASNPEAKEVYIGIYNAEAFAEIEKQVTKVPKMEIGKTTMGFSSKDLFVALQAFFGVSSTDTVYFELVPSEIESPVKMYKVVPYTPTAEELATIEKEATTEVSPETSHEAAAPVNFTVTEPEQDASALLVADGENVDVELS